MNTEPVMLCHCSSNGLDDLIRRKSAQTVFICVSVARLHLSHYNQVLFAVAIHGKRRATTRAQGRMALLDGPFDIWRIMVASPDDDKLLQATRDKKLLSPQEP